MVCHLRRPVFLGVRVPLTWLNVFVYFRRSHSLLKDILPRKTEFVILLRKSPVQHTLYRRFLTYFQGSLGYEGACLNPIKAFAVCCKVRYSAKLHHRYR